MAKSRRPKAASKPKRQGRKPPPPPKSVTATVDDASGTAESRMAVVGVGASAGGLDAFTQVLHALPADPRFAVVLVQHPGCHSGLRR